MTRTWVTAVAAVVAAALAASCATLDVGSHVAPDLDFARYHTYAWGPADALPTGDPRLDADPYFNDRLQGAVEKELARRGLRLAPSGTPDLLVHYHASVTERLDVNRVDLSYGYSVDPRSGLTRYDSGTIVLDLVDAVSGRVIWRGWAQTPLEELLDDPDGMVETIDEAVARMFQRFPGEPPER